MTTYATVPDGPRDLDAQMPRLVPAPRGQDLAADGSPTSRPGTARSTPAPASAGPGIPTSPSGVASPSGPASPSTGAVQRPSRTADLLWPIVHNLTSLVTAPLALTCAALAIAGFFSLPAVGSGVLLLVPALWGAWGLARVERHRIAAFLGVDIGERPPSTAPGWRVALGLDRNRLLALGWSGLHGLWGLVAAAITFAVLTQGVLLATLPLWAWWADQVTVLWAIQIRSLLGMTLAWVVGLVLLGATPLLAKGLAGVDIALARWLIGTDQEAELRAMSQRVQTLTTTRTETLDSVEAERRRIERDLHDGPQQRLVSIAMNLGLAREALDRNPDDPEAAALVRSLLDEAHSSSKEAIIEMRQVARGIVPPILADRGLDAAVSALADRHPVPVTVVSRLPDGRLEPTVEAIAYFCVSEALTNVAKHADATRVRVDLGTVRGLTGDLLALTVTDDGRGGAVVGGGSGLTGLRQRIAAVDGQLHVHSPVGSGTTVAITLPLRRIPSPEGSTR